MFAVAQNNKVMAPYISHWLPNNYQERRGGTQCTPGSIVLQFIRQKSTFLSGNLITAKDKGGDEVEIYSSIKLIQIH